MSQKALSMRKIKEVLRLRYDLGLLQKEIARSCSIGQSSVHRYLERASAVGLGWPLPEDCDDRRLNVDWAGATIPIYDRETSAVHGRALRSRTGRQLLHLCASHAQPGPFPLDRVSRAGF
jgi:hypothetical protein